MAFVSEAHSPAEKSLGPERVEIILCPALCNILNESQYKKQMFIPVIPYCRSPDTKYWVTVCLR